MKGFLQELRKRHVVKVGFAYLVVAWLVLQLADVIFPALGLPDWSITLALGLLAVGFPVALVLAWVFDLTPDGIERTDETGPVQEHLAPETATDPTQSPVTTQSIAVLPFPDFSAERDQEHFCDGLTEELLNVLTSIPDLRVASRTSCFAFKGKDLDLRAVGDKLHVAHILEGSVRKSGNKIRITAQLIEVATDSHLWSETYDRQLDDIFAIQDDIAARILEVLKLKLGDGGRCDPTTTSGKAYEYFLRGRGYAITKVTQDHDRAIAMFQKAVETDPHFVRAWIELAEISASQALFHGGGDDASQISEEAAGQAMKLAPERSGSYMARGFSCLAKLQYSEAESDFLKAIEINPGQVLAYHYAGRTAHLQGRLNKAREYFAKATELDPDDWESPLLALQGYEKEGDETGALRVAQIGVERAERHLEDYPDSPRAYYLGSTGLVTLGDTQRARDWAERALALSPDDNSTRYNVACFYAIIGETERSLDLLENSISSRSWMENDSELDSIRDHPRYKAIIKSLPE